MKDSAVCLFSVFMITLVWHAGPPDVASARSRPAAAGCYCLQVRVPAHGAGIPLAVVITRSPFGGFLAAWYYTRTRLLLMLIRRQQLTGVTCTGNNKKNICGYWANKLVTHILKTKAGRVGGYSVAALRGRAPTYYLPHQIHGRLKTNLLVNLF